VTPMRILEMGSRSIDDSPIAIEIIGQVLKQL
jgi:hypothetical protein